MKRNLLYGLAALLLLKIAAPDPAYSQKVKKWNYGVLAGLTSERFKVVKSDKYQNQILSTYTSTATSWLNFGGALWAERKLLSTWAAIPQIGYEFVHVQDNVLTGATKKSGNGSDFKETHHYLSLALHLRKYFLNNANLRLFVDGGVKADRLVRFKNEYWRYKNETWKPTTLKNIDPALLVAAGVKQGRWAVSAEYQYFLGMPLVKKYRGDLSPNGVKTNLERQNMSIRAAFTVFK
ncbi:porin family protein [Dyadobacter aurulentus]|uniref:outer membrane beta-barrel protein n=1 Tax=Dyadobacter sp. UC 10 TaxID=2605428 RepID=UPI0011F2B62B|nr:outer membrane beta-barrel protein [Dyadobacter sp. UC 10]KAA0988728.1 outer membrane beta-barrel protein [Dyadobacter sp. UC 10]